MAKAKAKVTVLNEKDIMAAMDLDRLYAVERQLSRYGDVLEVEVYEDLVLEQHELEYRLFDGKEAAPAAR